jgi:hypothetical protein
LGFTYVDVDSLEGEGPVGWCGRRAGQPAHAPSASFELRPGRFIRVDPDSTRVPIAGDEGLELITFGAPLEGAYEPPDWG